MDEIRIPGERAYRDRARLAREGLEIDRRIHDALIQLAEGRRGAWEAVAGAGTGAFQSAAVEREISLDSAVGEPALNHETST